MKTIEVEDTEALLVAVAVREYLNPNKYQGEKRLSDHPTSRLVIENFIKKLDPGEGASS